MSFCQQCPRRSQFSFLYRTQQTNLNTIPGFSFPIVWLGKIFTNSTKFMWRKGHIGSEFCSQYLHESEMRENSFWRIEKLLFRAFGLLWRNFGRKRVIIQSRSNIDFAFILLPLTLSFLFWGMRLVSLSDVSFKLLQQIYFLKSTWKVNKLALDKKI